MSGAAGGCGRCGGSRVHAGSDLTLDSRARVRVHYTGSCTPPPPLSPCALHSEHPSRSPFSVIALYQRLERRYPPNIHSFLLERWINMTPKPYQWWASPRNSHNRWEQEERRHFLAWLCMVKTVRRCLYRENQKFAKWVFSVRHVDLSDLENKSR